mgnify:CR=1 FL=1
MSTQQRGEKTRARILDAAAIGFAEQGYDSTSVAEICHRAEVSKGAFYHHFSSKQDLFMELLQHWLSGLDAHLAALRARNEPVPQQLLGMTEMICHVFEAAQDQLPMFLEFWAKAAHDPAVWEATITPYRRYRAFFTEMIETGIQQGKLRAVDPDTAARVIVSLAVGLVLQGLLDAEGADWAYVAERSMHMLLQGIAVETDAGSSLTAHQPAPSH